MKNLGKEETSLVGSWILVGKEMRSDEVESRIIWLVSEVLEEIADSREYGAWETLFRDPSDGRYWERTYPHSGMHGGGPLALRMITEEMAHSKYDF